MDNELLTTREVQSLVRLNRITIYRLIREGEFPAIKVGGQWRFPPKHEPSFLGLRFYQLPLGNAA
jgi:excisionase family DNA binding protein